MDASIEKSHEITKVEGGDAKLVVGFVKDLVDIIVKKRVRYLCLTPNDSLVDLFFFTMTRVGKKVFLLMSFNQDWYEETPQALLGKGLELFDHTLFEKKLATLPKDIINKIAGLIANQQYVIMHK